MSDQDYENTIGRLDDHIAELQAKYDALKEAVEDAAEGFEGAAQGHGIDFYAYASDMRAALQRADNE